MEVDFMNLMFQCVIKKFKDFKKDLVNFVQPFSLV